MKLTRASYEILSPSEAAHPQMRELMIPLLDELKTKLPVIFDDL